MSRGYVLTGMGSYAALVGVLLGYAHLPGSTAMAGGGRHAVYFEGTAGTGTYFNRAALYTGFTSRGYKYTETANWQDVLDAHDARAIDVLLFDSGSVSSVDDEWTQHMYWDTGMVIAGIEVYNHQLRSLLKDTRIRGDSSQAYSAEFAVVINQGFDGNVNALATMRADPLEADESGVSGVGGRWYYDAYVALPHLDGGDYPFYWVIDRGLDTREEYYQ